MKTKTIKVRVSEDEYVRIRSVAMATGRTVSDLIREAIWRPREWTEPDRRAVEEMIRQVARIGNNLNQLARQVNALGPNTDVLAVHEALLRIQKDLRRLIEDVRTGRILRAGGQREEKKKEKIPSGEEVIPDPDPEGKLVI
ncbi:TPA: MobC family plasmid mobilization relaxosome protein [Candidatus Micrarchaeota archaeon]|nr:MobC family plasmid mobilization relaxosome protein [Candidatus Micrarchaeota archaeon]